MFTELSNGLKIPVLFFGTDITKEWHAEKNLFKYYYKKTKSYCGFYLRRNKKEYNLNKNLLNILTKVIKTGLIGIDTSRAYGGSEFLTGKAIKITGKSPFVCTKLSNPYQKRDAAKEGYYKSIEQLGMDTIDLYLLHWPYPEKYVQSWLFLETLYNQGLCRSIGVSNFKIKHIEKLKNNCSILPMVNEIECHPLYQQKELCDYCKRNGIKIMSYTSTARMIPEITNNVVLKRIAQKHSCSIASVIIAWHIQEDRIPIVNTLSFSHLSENLSAENICLSKEELKEIDNLDEGKRLRYDADTCDFDKL